MGTARLSHSTKSKTTTESAQKRTFTPTKSHSANHGTAGVGSTSRQVGPQTNWAEVEAKAQQESIVPEGNVGRTLHLLRQFGVRCLTPTGSPARAPR
jgi:hypothetical protein